LKSLKGALTCLLFLLPSIFACEKSKDKSNVIAIVGEESLTMDELMNQIPAYIRSDISSVVIREFVLRWINDQVLYQEAKARKIDEKPEVQHEFEMLKRDLLINKLIESTLESDINVSNEEIQAYYDANNEGFILSEDMVHAYHVLVKSQEEAREVRRRLRGGESFESVTKFTTDDSLAMDEWDLGYFTKDEVIPEISSVVFKMAVNALSFPIKSDFGYHIVKLVDRQKKGDIKKFDLVKDEIKHKLITKKKEDKYQRFLLQMKSKIKIQTNFKLLDSSIIDSILHEGDGQTYE